MQGNTRLRNAQPLAALWHGLVIVSIVMLALLGVIVEEQGCWVVQGIAQAAAASGVRDVRRGREPGRLDQETLWLHLVQTGEIALARSLLLWALWEWSGQVGPAWLRLWPWLIWVWRGVGLCWPGLGRQCGWQQVNQWLAQGQQWLMLGYVGLGIAGWIWPSWGHGGVGGFQG